MTTHSVSEAAGKIGALLLAGMQIGTTLVEENLGIPNKTTCILFGSANPLTGIYLEDTPLTLLKYI